MYIYICYHLASLKQVCIYFQHCCLIFFKIYLLIRVIISWRITENILNTLIALKLVSFYLDQTRISENKLCWLHCFRAG